jgi:hypothetical protein
MDKLRAAFAGRELTKKEQKSIQHVNEFLSKLEDHVLVEVTISTVCNCAFRLAVDRDTVDVNPTTEVFAQAMRDTLKLIGESVK